MADQMYIPGIARCDIYSIRFYESAPFNGSYRGMHYRIEGIRAAAGHHAKSRAAASAESRQKEAAGSQEQEEALLCVTVWPGPYNYATTDASKKVTAHFPFSNAGLDAVTDYLNQYYKEHFA